MRCAYCFYSDVSASREIPSYGIMQRETARAIIKNIFAGLVSGDEITIAFQGGEPTLAGLNFYTDFTAAVDELSAGIQVKYTLQTNGLLLNESFIDFLKSREFLVGLSLDGPVAVHNQNRVDNKENGTYGRVIRAKKLLDAKDVPYNILCVLTAESTRHVRRLWDFILAEKIGYVQFIPCLEPLDGIKSGAALTPERFYRFYSELFPLWQAAAEKGRYVSVKLFEDLAVLFIKGQAGSCGLAGGCSPQIVVEADGSVYPCDFYVLDRYKLADLTKMTLKQTFEAVIHSDFLQSEQYSANKCGNCRYYPWCRGGCKRMKRAVYSGKNGNCGFKDFLDERLDALLKFIVV